LERVTISSGWVQESELRLSAGFLLLLFAFQNHIVRGQSAPSPTAQYFFNKASFPTGKSPDGVAIADMNGDGRIDLVVANANGPSVSILLGQSDGTFGPKTDFVLQEAPVVLVASDFNGDGKIDVAVTGSSGVTVLPGNGDGTLGTPVTYPSANSPSLLAVSDFNHDGKQDLAIAGACGNTCGFVSVLLGKGDGTFQAGTDFSAGGVPSEWAVADLNGDGIPDLAFANMAANSYNGGTAGLVSVLLGKGDGTFQTPVNYASGTNIAGIAAGDVTGDKIPDLIVTHFTGDIVTMLKGNGDGTFQAQQPLSSDTSQDTSLSSDNLQLLDVNKDGKLDLVLSSALNGGVTVLIGNGDGTFQRAQSFTTGTSAFFFAAADVSGDGNLDLAVVDSYDPYVTILLGNGDGTFSPRKDLLSDWLSGVGSGVVGDFNGDGMPDIAVSTSSGFAVVLGKEKGTFQPPIAVSLPPLASSGRLAEGDFNRDGHLDLIANGTTFLPGNGDGTFGTPVAVNSDLDIRSFVVGDFNNDGYLDLVDVGNGFYETQPMQVLLGKGDGTFQAPRRFWNLPQIPDKVVAADFNHDGNLDLALTLNPNGVAILLGTGGGSFAPPVIYATDALPDGLGAADLNGDGAVDLIATGSLVDVFLGKGDGTFPTRVDYALGVFPSQVAAGDFNSDGKLDLAVTGYGSGPGYLGILFGNGDGTFQTPLLYTDNAPTGAPIAVADLNGDGIDDALVAAQGGSLFLSGPMAMVSPSLLAFGTVATGTTSASLPITVTNGGNSPLNVTGAVTTAPFSIAAPVCPSALARLANCEIPVVFAPSTPGQQNGQVSLQVDVANAKPVVLVTGTAVNPSLAFTPTSLTFSSEAVGSTSAAQTITVTNTSSVAVAITSVIANGPFAVSSQCGASLAAAATCSIAVTFTPTTVGQQTGSLTISDDAVGSTQNIALSGSGVAALSVAPQAGQPTSVTVGSGGAATYGLVLTAGPGVGGTSSLTCSGAPANATCNMTPSSLALTAGGSENFSVTVTTSQQVATIQDRSLDLQLAGIGLLFGASMLPVFIRRLRLPAGLAILVALLAILPIAGCGGSSSTKAPSAQNAAPGTYQLVVTATVGSAKATQTLTLVVE
jgi:FG-GAP-like repeat/Abnormal spindle-like microcephaly-assoc'd, ASPM-SPD-2-Hydin